MKVTARCFPTEDRAKVAEAVAKLFPGAVAQGDDPVVFTADSVEHFAELLKRQRIRAAARSILRRGLSGDSVVFSLNKQVATAGKVSFSEEQHALGDLEVVITADDIEGLIDDIAPRALKEGGDAR